LISVLIFSFNTTVVHKNSCGFVNEEFPAEIQKFEKSNKF
jgi:hypothetical protein